MQVQQRSARILAPGEGHTIWIMDSLHIDKLTGAETNGGLFLFEARVPPAGGPPPHIHHAEDEIFYLLRGEITVWADGVECMLAPGAVAHIPRGTVHTFRNTGEEDALLLIIATPAGLERYFAAVGTPAVGDTPPAITEETIGRLLAGAPAHNLEFVLP